MAAVRQLHSYGLEPVLKVGGTGYQSVFGDNLPPKHPAGW